MNGKIPLSLLTALLTAGPLSAADTVEVWETGAIDLELYLGTGGLGAPAGNRETSGDLVLGFGAAPGLSTYFATTLSANGHLAAGRNTLSVGALAAVRDGRTFDLDLLLNLASDGESGLSVEPSLELNWDREPDQGSWGCYARVGLGLGPSVPTAKSGAYGASGVDADVAVLAGVYLGTGAGRQLLLELDVLRHEDEYIDGEHWEYGGVALGWNQVLGPGLELILELRHDLPQGEERRTWGASVGFISGLPVGGS